MPIKSFATVPKSWTQSKTIRAALFTVVTLLLAAGVKKANPDSPSVQQWADGLAVVLTLLGQVGVITFRASATQPIGDPTAPTDAGGY